MQKNIPAGLLPTLHGGEVPLLDTEPIAHNSIATKKGNGLVKRANLQHSGLSSALNHDQPSIQRFGVRRQQGSQRPVVDARSKREEWAPEKVGRRLRMLRAAHGLIQSPPQKISQTAFARSAGLSQGAYTNYENALRVPSIAHAAKLCDRYGVTLDWIYRGRVHNSMTFDLIDAIRDLSKAE